jgi:glycosyltransferase involved in cell wall biosynthesis/Flp pilus assembly protein TadD
MGLRTTSLTPGAERRLTPDEARGRLERTLAAAEGGMRAGGTDRLAGAFAEVSAWGDPHRRYQARRDLARLVMHAPEGRVPWPELYVEAAHHLIEALDDEPAEPGLLNEAGILLYELGEAAAAETLFRAAQRLDPDLPHVAGNLEEARRKKRGRAAPLPKAVAVRARGLAARARRVASLAGPTAGLTLSLCMIVKDEEEMLPGCLEAVRDAVDEIVVVDTGSTDSTVEIARSFGAVVVELPWNGSFADARNASLERATCDWILYLDADEHLVPEDARELRGVLGRTWREGFYLVETNYVGGDEVGSAITHLALRVFRNRAEYRFEGRIHEQKTRNMPTYLAERFEATTVRVRHYGYLRSVFAGRDKSRRNVELLEAERREGVTAFNSFNLASERLALGETREARRLFDESWELLRTHGGWEQVGYAPLLVARVAKARRESGDPAGALAAVEEGLAVFPDHTDLVFEAALAAREQGDLARTRELAGRCLAMGDAPARYAATVGAGTFLALGLLADVEQAEGRPAAAIACWRRSLREHPEFTGPVLPLASALLATGSSPEQVAAELPAGKASVLLLLGTALFEAGRAAEAERCFREVLARQPANGVARIGLLEALLSQRRFAEAAVEAGSEPADSPVAALAAVDGLFARAAAADADGLSAALAVARDRGVARAELDLYAAWLARLRGDAVPGVDVAVAAPAESALEALLRVQELDGFATLYDVYQRVPLAPRERRERMARMYLRRGFLDSAAEEWLAACADGPDARALVGLAQLAWAKGLADDALVFAGEAAALDPHDREVLALRSELQRRLAA